MNLEIVAQLMKRSAGYDHRTPKPDDNVLLTWQEAFAKHNLTPQIVWEAIPDACLDPQLNQQLPVLARIVQKAREARRDLIERNPELQQQLLDQIDAKVREIQARPARAPELGQGMPAAVAESEAMRRIKSFTFKPKTTPAAQEDPDRRAAAIAELDELRARRASSPAPTNQAKPAS